MRSSTFKIPDNLFPVVEAIRSSPSPHNSQPWQLWITSEKEIQLHWDRNRTLKVADQKGEGIGFALGCAIEAAHTAGEISFFPSEGRDLKAPEWYAGHLKVKKAPKGDCSTANPLLDNRRTNRFPYKTREVESWILQNCQTCASHFNNDLAVITDRKKITRIGKYTEEAARDQFSDEAYLSELMTWVRFSAKEEDWDEDGFSPESIGLNPATSRVFRLLKDNPAARSFVQKFGLARIMAMEAGAGIKKSGALFLIVSDDDSPQGLIASGRAMMRIWLEITRAGLVFQPVDYALSSPALRQSVLEDFGVPNRRGVFLLRVGYPLKPTGKSARLPLERICMNKINAN